MPDSIRLFILLGIKGLPHHIYFQRIRPLPILDGHTG
jgi:hypothetical protein